MSNDKVRYRILATIDADKFAAVLAVICDGNAEPDIEVQQISPTVEHDMERLVRSLPTVRAERVAP